MTVLLINEAVSASSGSKLSSMREVERRHVSEGKGVDYDLVVYWDPVDGKVYLAKVTDQPEPENVLEIEPGQIGYHLQHASLIPFGE